MRALVEAARCATAVVKVAGVVKDCERYKNECRRHGKKEDLQSLKLVYGMPCSGVNAVQLKTGWR